MVLRELLASAWRAFAKGRSAFERLTDEPLGALPSDTLIVQCNRCGLSKNYLVEQLIRQYGNATMARALEQRMRATCRHEGRCGLRFPQLDIPSFYR